MRARRRVSGIFTKWRQSVKQADESQQTLTMTGGGGGLQIC